MRFGSTPYIASRAKSRRKALADRARLRQLINHAPDQLTVAVADLGYRAEIDRYAATYDGGDLIEAALTDNLEHELDNIIKLCSGKVARIVSVYTDRFEYHNAKAVLRAVVNDVDLERVAHDILPDINDINTPWLGDVNGGTHFAENGVYHWVIKAADFVTDAQEFRGYVHLMR